MFPLRTSHRCSRWAVALFNAALALCLLGTLTGKAQAAPPPVSSGQVWQAVGNQTLDSLRGGFNLGGGLMVSFGITRTVFINGDLVTQTTLNLGRLSDITPEWAAQLRQELQSIRLVQNGPGNTFITSATPITSHPGVVAPGPSAAADAMPTPSVPANPTATPTTTAISGTASGTVIQNTLNNQQILHQTIINASSNGLGMLRLSTLHRTLSEAIRESVGQR